MLYKQYIVMHALNDVEQFNLYKMFNRVTKNLNLKILLD